jgi:hypothetical protein
MVRAARGARWNVVARQAIDEGGAADVATLVGGERHRAEARQRPSTSVRGAQAIPAGSPVLETQVSSIGIMF